jgi:hypothetical protein
MPRPLRCHPQSFVASERHELDDIVGRLGEGDVPGTLVSGEIPRPAGGIPPQVGLRHDVKPQSADVLETRRASSAAVACWSE